MKPFFSSQAFIRENENGVEFTLSYTQPMEVLPFIKRWLPGIKILEFNEGELEEILKRDLQAALESYS